MAIVSVAPRPTEQQFLQITPQRLDCRQAFRLKALICIQRGQTRFRKLGSPVLGAAPVGSDERFFETTVHRANKQPGSHVGHFQLEGSLPDGPGLADGPQQFDFPRPKGDFVAAINSKTGGNHTLGSFLLACH